MDGSSSCNLVRPKDICDDRMEVRTLSSCLTPLMMLAWFCGNASVSRCCHCDQPSTDRPTVTCRLSQPRGNGKLLSA